MPTPLKNLLTILVAIGISTSFFTVLPQQSKAAPSPVSIGFIGDSITAGYGATSPIYGEVNSLKDKGIQVLPVNGGISGTTSGNWHPTTGTGIFATTLATFKSKNVSVVSIMLGTNDAKAAVNTSNATYKANIQAITSALLIPGTGVRKVILNCAPWVSDTNSYAMSSSVIDSYCSQLQSLTNGQTIIQGDTSSFAYFQSHTDRLYDGVHPDNQGTSYLGGLWADAAYPSLNYDPSLTLGIISDQTSTSVTLHWTTSATTADKVTYGTVSGLNSETPVEGSLSNTHVAALSNLLPCRRYLYTITSTAPAQATQTTGENSFTTLCPDGALITASTQKVIDPSTGGLLSLKDDSNGISLKAAAGFSEEPLNFQINKLAQAVELPKDYQLVFDQVYGITAVTDTENLVANFDTAFTVTIQLSTQSLSGIDPTKLILLHKHTDTWEPLSHCSINKLAGTISCPVSQFSVFALAYPDPGATSLTTVSSSKDGAASSPTAKLAETGEPSYPFLVFGTLLLVAAISLSYRSSSTKRKS